MHIQFCEQYYTRLVAFSTVVHSDNLESSAINDGRSIFAMYLSVLHVVEGLETETMKKDLMQ